MTSSNLTMRVLINYIFLSLILLFITSSAAVGQTLISRVYMLEEGILSFKHAQSMTVTIAPNQIGLQVGEFFFIGDAESDLRVQISRPTPIAQFAQVGFGDTLSAILASRLQIWQQTAPTILASLTNTTVSGVSSATDPQQVLINELPAMWATIYYTWAEQTAATFVAVLDVGNQYVMTIIASPALGDAANILANRRADLNTLINSVRYIPHVDRMGIQTLPLTYMGEIGRLRTGVLTFAYPKNWHVLPIGGNIIITNTNLLAINELVSGQMQLQIIPPDFNLTTFATNDQIVNCAIGQDVLAQITPLALLERQMLNPRRLASYQADGVTYIAPQTIHLGDRSAAYMMLFAPNRDAFVVAVDLGEGNIASFMALSASNEMGQYTSDLFSIAASFRYESSACIDLTPEGDL